jgi:hypothetical protein
MLPEATLRARPMPAPCVATGRPRGSRYADTPMEKTPKEEPKPAETPSPPKKEGESYEDNWYQVLKRRAEEVPDDDETTED